MNSIGVDSLMAEDSTVDSPVDHADDLAENIGRFCPIEPGGVPAGSGGIDDLGTDPAKYRYNFALDLFDYLDVYSPQQDYFPGVDPGESGVSAPPTWAKFTPNPQPVANGPITDSSLANFGNEDGVGVEGKININTADWRVLSSIPFTPAKNTIPALNQQIAQAIIAYREANGPFKSIFELQKIAGFKNAKGAISDPDPDDDSGDFSPFNGYSWTGGAEAGKTDLVVNDYEATFLNLTRISNIITTRSDSYTVYVVVQGWRNAGSANPELVVQRRAAYIADRCAVHPVQPTAAPVAAGATVPHTPMNIISVPNN